MHKLLECVFFSAFSTFQRDMNADQSPAYIWSRRDYYRANYPPSDKWCGSNYIGTAKGGQLIRLLGGPGTVPKALLEFKAVWRLHRLSLILSPHLMLHTDMTLNYVYNMSMRFRLKMICLLPVLYTVCIHHLAFWLMIEFCFLHLYAIYTVHEHTHTHAQLHTHERWKTPDGAEQENKACTYGARFQFPCLQTEGSANGDAKLRFQASEDSCDCISSGVWACTGWNAGYAGETWPLSSSTHPTSSVLVWTHSASNSGFRHLQPRL
jgi:hypothetical protein